MYTEVVTFTIVIHVVKLSVACEQVNELKKQLEQMKQQGDSSMLDDVAGDQGDLTFRLGHTTSSDNKQKEKIRQIERQRREANDVRSFSYSCSL